MSGAAEYLASAIKRACPGLPVRRVRFESEAEAAGPAVRYRLLQRGDSGLLDRGRSAPIFEIECRSPTVDGARYIATAILDRLTADGAVSRVVDDGDVPAHASALRGNFYAVEITVEIGAVPAVPA